MVVELPAAYEERLRDLAEQQGRAVRLLVEDAIRGYLESEAITDLEPATIGETQMILARELESLERDGGGG